MPRRPAPLAAVAAFALLALLPFARAAAPATTALVGTWRIDLARSTELSPWKSYDLTIALAGDTVTLDRKLAWGRRDFTDRLVVDTAKPETTAPIDWSQCR